MKNSSSSSVKEKDHLHHSVLLKKLLQYLFYGLIPVIVFRFYYYPSPPPPTPPDSLFFSPLHNDEVGKIDSIATSSLSDDQPPTFPPQPSSSQDEEEEEDDDKEVTLRTTSCDYTEGEWVPTTTPPLYNGTTCSQTIKDNQNCISHGRPDLTYLYYNWQPKTCTLPPFTPSTLLTSLKNKHLAFIGDSMARNQLESLICLLSSHISPQLIYSYPENDIKFRRWWFPYPHNVTISVYWSPFLVSGVEKSSSVKYYNTLFLDSPDPNWVRDLPGFDMVVLTIGHWYLHQAVYYENGKILGCNGCGASFNYTEIGFYGVFRKAYETALNTITRRRRVGGILQVFVTTFMPSHFEGEWDKLGACNKTTPYKESEVQVEGMNAEMRRIVLEEAKRQVVSDGDDERVRISVLDITKLSLLRPDGHPGPYMYAFPFADGVVKERVHQDCLHFCLPGPIDTWNQIMADMILNKPN